MRCVSRRLMPVTGSKRARRTSPESTTTRTPGMVRLVSAMLVASTTLRCPGAAGVLGLAGQLPEQRPHLHRGAELGGRERGLHAPYLARPGQKHQHIAAF